MGDGCWINSGNLTCPVKQTILCPILWDAGFMARGPVSGTESTTAAVSRQLSRQTARLLAVSLTVFASINKPELEKIEWKNVHH
jgi:hypothetical protein